MAPKATGLALMSTIFVESWAQYGFSTNQQARNIANAFFGFQLSRSLDCESRSTISFIIRRSITVLFFRSKNGAPGPHFRLTAILRHGINREPFFYAHSPDLHVAHRDSYQLFSRAQLFRSLRVPSILCSSLSYHFASSFVL